MSIKKASLAVLAFVVLTSSALAFSPTWSNVPDVVIGNCEGGGYVFTDAFDFFDYVDDQDTTSDSIRIVFADGPWNGSLARAEQAPDDDLTTEITINDKDEVDYTGGVSGIPSGDFSDSAKVVNDGGVSKATLKSLVGATDRAVWLIASDLSTTAGVSNVIRVQAIDGECDNLTSDVVITTEAEWDTNLNVGNNTTGPFDTGLFFGGGDGTTTGDGNNLTLGTNGTTFASATTFDSTGATYVAADPNKLYRVRTQLYSSQTANNLQPEIRSGFAMNDLSGFWFTRTSANGVQYSNDPLNPTNVDTYFRPAAGISTAQIDGLKPQVTIVGGGTAAATLTIQKITLVSIAGLDSMFGGAYTVDDTGDIAFNTSLGVINASSLAEVVNAGSVAVTATGVAPANKIYSGQVGYSPAVLPFTQGSRTINQTTFEVAADTLYRVTYSCVGDGTDPFVTFTFRLYDNGSALDINHLTLTEYAPGAGTNTIEPPVGGKTYEAYFDTALLTDAGKIETGRVLSAAFDVRDFTVGRAGTFTVDRIEIESVDLTAVPALQ